MVKIHLLLSMTFFPCQIYSLSLTEPVCYLQKQWPCTSLLIQGAWVGQEEFSSINLDKISSILSQNTWFPFLFKEFERERNICYWWLLNTSSDCPSNILEENPRQTVLGETNTNFLFVPGLKDTLIISRNEDVIIWRALI